jgi:uncharacterized protein YbjQ (UPF0145 family)
MVQTLYQARHRALSRMSEECEELGGHGVVGVRLSIGAFPAGGMEFKAIGTAVRAPGGVPLKRPFTSDLSGQDFAKLIMADWVPAGMAMGISIGARHDDWLTINQTRWGTGNAEVTGYTDLVNESRHDARTQLDRDVARMGAEGVVVKTMDIRIHDRECPMVEHRKDRHHALQPLSRRRGPPGGQPRDPLPRPAAASGRAGAARRGRAAMIRPGLRPDQAGAPVNENQGAR